MKKGTRIGIIGLLAGAGAAGGFAALGAALYDRVMVPGGRPAVRDVPAPALCREGRAWVEGAEGFREAGIRSVEGLRLWAAWLPAAGSHRWAVCVHGFRGDHTSMGVYAKHYHEAGWNVLLPDQRAHGRSEGTYTGWGYEERLDLVGWISWVLRRDPRAEVLLHGVSMGAATVLMATGGALPRNVKAAVSDGAYTTLEAELRHISAHRPAGGEQQLAGLSWLAAYRALHAAVLHRAGFDLNRVSPIEAVSRSKTPTLFIHGTGDGVVPAQMMGRLSRAAKCPAQSLWIPDGKHAVTVATHPELYWNGVDSFLRAYMPAPEMSGPTIPQAPAKA